MPRDEGGYGVGMATGVRGLWISRWSPGMSVVAPQGCLGMRLGEPAANRWQEADK